MKTPYIPSQTAHVGGTHRKKERERQKAANVGLFFRFVCYVVATTSIHWAVSDKQWPMNGIVRGQLRRELKNDQLLYP